MISEEVSCTVVIFCRVAALAIEAGAAAAVVEAAAEAEAVAAVITAGAKELLGTTRYLKPLTTGFTLHQVFTLYMQDGCNLLFWTVMLDCFLSARYSILKHPTVCIP
jgi:hypothetical protein